MKRKQVTGLWRRSKGVRPATPEIRGGLGAPCGALQRLGSRGWDCVCRGTANLQPALPSGAGGRSATDLHRPEARAGAERERLLDRRRSTRGGRQAPARVREGARPARLETRGVLELLEGHPGDRRSCRGGGVPWGHSDTERGRPGRRGTCWRRLRVGLASAWDQGW
ncbi:hypothetical protein NDU88_000571 [Pleurodeles waltl]|uniref:Uncharacterized protein n=1 Tax=Pleurodeles waltl TaxID=8319 RepID=A0AAV7UQD2_PLEWA|nr:hypothetical protein NDU88_000571 [Pleurodeles waltl]